VSLSIYKRDAASDLLLTQWWARLICDETECRRVFSRETTASLHSFLSTFQPPNQLVFKSDLKLGLWFAVWLEPALSGAFVGLWCRDKMRHTKAALEAGEEALDYGLYRYPVLIGVTKQEKLLDAHRRLGYNVLGKIPRIFDGEDAWIVHITRESFEARKTYLVQRPERESQWVEAVKQASP